MKRKTKEAVTTAKPRAGRAQVFTLDVTIASGPMSERFARENPVISRTIEIRGDQTLAQLHRAIFAAFDREDEHMYEFQVGGKGPMDPQARRYVLPMDMDDPFGDVKPAGEVNRTAIGSLGLRTGETFGYWFDFGDDWWHRIEVLAVEQRAPPPRTRSGVPRVTKRIGQSPPQYADWDEEE
jgi:hypothetical protein